MCRPAPCPITRMAQVRLSWPHATAVGANMPGTYLLYELIWGANSSVSSRRAASCPARKCSNSVLSAANTFEPSDPASDKCTWHELPSRWSTFDMNENAKTSCAGIHVDASLYIE